MIVFATEETKFNFKSRRLVKQWITDAVKSENAVPGDISVIFCSDPYLLEMNKKYLGHDYYTDVITFDYVEGNVISGDIYISVDTVKANAEEYGATFEEELHRVIIHGVLHLLGYDDHEENDIAKMRERENHYLGKLFESKGLEK